eukprot:CFRG1969T1
MREIQVSTAEKQFILDNIKRSKRLDGRGVYDYRKIKLTYGTEYGHVEVQLGRSRAMCQVTATAVPPNEDRPTEGFVLYNTELTQIAAPHFETGRPSELAIEIGRVVERGLRDSRAIETEGLCIVAGEKVWQINVDISILDDCGNIIDCAALAAVAALKHFRRPDVTVVGETATIHTLTEKEPIPLGIQHSPYTVTFGFFNGGEYMVVDPSLEEERVMEGRLTMTVNTHREICAMHKSGGVSLLPDQIMRCAKVAAIKVTELNEMLNSVLDEAGVGISNPLPNKQGERTIGQEFINEVTKGKAVNLDGNDTPSDMFKGEIEKELNNNGPVKVTPEGTMDVDDSASGESDSGDSDSEEEETTVMTGV